MDEHIEATSIFDIFTLFPSMFAGPMGESIIKRAVDTGKVAINIHDIRTWTTDRHHTADDRPYGGGAGMVMMAPPIVEGVESILPEGVRPKVLLMSAAGRSFDQEMAFTLAREHHIILICGHYEGVDDRVRTILQAEEISIGDFVLTGGELPAMTIVDAVTRLLPGVIADESTDEESHQDGLVEYPHYTRPPEYRGLAVPEVLLSGHHAEIAKWRAEQARKKTARRRDG